MSPPVYDDKENILSTCKASGMDPTKPLNKARRITLAPVVRHVPVQTKRRASIATLPTEAERHQALPETRQDRIGSTIQTSQLRLPRRRSVAAFTSFQGTSQAAATPEAKWKFGGSASSSKYASPPLWKSKIPTIFSPRQRLRLISSPANSSSSRSAQQAVSKLCFSVQKRVIVGSPSKTKHSMLPGSLLFAPREKEIVGRLGTAQRVLCKNRRKSVI